MRCFISILLPEEIKKEMSDIQTRFRSSGSDVSWTKPDGMHLTLKFLGEIEEKGLAKIEESLNMAACGISPFLLTVLDTGVFPDLRRPRVVWLGLKEDGTNLTRLQRGIEKELETIGFPPEKRRFSPHVTLGRIRSNKNLGRLLHIMEEEKISDPGTFRVSNVHLMKSDLRPAGAVYSELYSVTLKGD